MAALVGEQGNIQLAWMDENAVTTGQTSRARGDEISLDGEPPNLRVSWCRDIDDCLGTDALWMFDPHRAHCREASSIQRRAALENELRLLSYPSDCSRLKLSQSGDKRNVGVTHGAPYETSATESGVSPIKGRNCARVSKCCVLFDDDL